MEEPRRDQQTQVTEWLDAQLWEKYENQMEDMQEQMNDMQTELLGAEEMVENLESLKEARRRQDDSLRMFGQVIHFDNRCPHWSDARDIQLCSKCRDEGAALDLSEAP